MSTGEGVSVSNLMEPSALTAFAIQGNYLMAGTVDPTVVTTPGRRGTVYIQVSLSGSVLEPIGIFQKQDEGDTTNWLPIAGGGSTNTILNGPADPGPGDGTNGDFWINTTTNYIFGPKTAGVWPAGVSMVGPAGPVGPPGPAGPSGTAEFVYQPGGVTGGNIYATWAALYADLSLVNGPKTIYIDDSIVSPAVIPASGGPAYNLADCTLVGSKNIALNNVVAAVGTVCQLATGVQWTGLRSIRNLHIDAQFIAANVETISSPDALYLEDVQIDGNATASIWNITASRFVVCQSGGSIGTSATPVFNTAPGNYFIWNVSSSAAWPYKYATNEPFNSAAVGGGAFKYVNVVSDDVYFSFALETLFTNGVQLSSSPKWQAFVPTTPANWSPALAANPGYNAPTVQQALDNLAARASSAGVIFSQILVVAKNGNDATADGTWQKPYLTVQGAMSAITDASPTKRYVIFVMPGRYTETNLQLKANVFIVGHSYFTTRIANNVAIIPDAATFTPDADNRIGFVNINIASALNIDFNAASSNQGKFYANGCQIAAGITLTALSGGSNINQSIIDDCQIFGGLTQYGWQGVMMNTIVQTGNVVVNPRADGLGNSAIDIQTTVIHGNLTIGTGTAYPIAATLRAATCDGIVTFNGSGVTASVSNEFLTSSPVVLNSAVVNLLSKAQNEGYTPAVPGDWSPVPTQVKEALDQLAARPVGTVTSERETYVLAAAAPSQALAFLADHDTVIVNLEGAGLLMEGVGNDYTLSDAAVTTVNFSPAISALIVAGQKVQIQYLR